MYRPEGWENPYQDEYHDREKCGGSLCRDELAMQEAFEAGADAMLEALKKEGYRTMAKENLLWAKMVAPLVKEIVLRWQMEDMKPDVPPTPPLRIASHKELLKLKRYGGKLCLCRGTRRG